MEFRSYDSAEEMMADMRRNEEAAIASTFDDQRDITWDDRWFRLVTVSPDQHLSIFGHVHSLARHTAGELGIGSYPDYDDHKVQPYIDELEDVIGTDWWRDRSSWVDLHKKLTGVGLTTYDRDEFVTTSMLTVESYDRGYRMGQAWSVVETRGELGSTHVSTMLPIDEAEFELARGYSWDLDAAIRDRQAWAYDLAERWNSLAWAKQNQAHAADKRSN